MAQKLQNGDVIIADTAEDETTGKAVEIAGITDNFAVSGLHTMVARPNIKFAPKYLGYYLNAPSYHSKLLPLMQGIKVLSLSKTNIAKTEIMYPQNIDEQEKIGTFFASLDKLITLHQRMLLLFFIAVYISLDNDLITKSVSWFSSSCIMCKYVFCVVVILECPNRLATLAIVTPSNNSNDAWV